MSKKIKYIDIFLIISVSNTVFFLLINYIKDGYCIRQTLLSWQNQFSDYFIPISIVFESENVYKSNGLSPFPPFAYAFYRLLWMIIPTTDLTFADWKSFKYYENNLTVYLLYNVIQIILLTYITNKIINQESAEKRMFFLVSIAMSYPLFATSLQRGNSVLLTSIILIISFYLYEKNNFKREISYIFIAVAAGFKAYPAICGIQLIKEKRWPDVIRLLIYGLLLFFVPFIWFGGLDSFKTLLADYILRMRISEPRMSTFKGLAYFICTQYMNLTKDKSLEIAGIFSNIILILLLFSFFVTKIRWKEILFLSGILAAYIPSGWMYTSAYLLAPLLFFLRNNRNEKINITGFIYIFLFGFIFSLPYVLLSNPVYGMHGGIFLLITVLLITASVETIGKELSLNKM